MIQLSSLQGVIKLHSKHILLANLLVWLLVLALLVCCVWCAVSICAAVYCTCCRGAIREALVQHE